MLDEYGVKKYPARRWVGERTLAWLSKCRSVLARYEKKSKTIWLYFSSLVPCFGIAACQNQRLLLGNNHI